MNDCVALPQEYRYLGTMIEMSAACVGQITKLSFVPTKKVILYGIFIVRAYVRTF